MPLVLWASKGSMHRTSVRGQFLKLVCPDCVVHQIQKDVSKDQFPHVVVVKEINGNKSFRIFYPIGLQLPNNNDMGDVALIIDKNVNKRYYVFLRNDTADRTAAQDLADISAIMGQMK